MQDDVVSFNPAKGAAPLFHVERRGHVRFDGVRLTYPSRPGYRCVQRRKRLRRIDTLGWARGRQRMGS
jgi:hypothetical protein